jgi:cyanobactin maturation PatA/PatG family protease
MASFPRDLTGLPSLQASTMGDPNLVIAVIDGPVDVEHPALRAANLRPVPGAELPAAAVDDATSVHGTHVTSVIFGQPGTAVHGIAPAATGMILPIFQRGRRRVPQLEIARSIERALDAGAHIINISGGQYVDAGIADDFLEKAMATCHERGVLIVAAAGNDGCECLHVPAALRTALAVGALGDDGEALETSNWGDAYLTNGILAPGENVLGAVPGGGTTRATGTSAATPVVTGVAALLASRELALGRPLDLLAVRRALLKGARPCPDPGTEACRRMLGGLLDINLALQILDQEAAVHTHAVDDPVRGEAAAGVAAETSHSVAGECTCGRGGAGAQQATASAVPSHLAEVMPEQDATTPTAGSGPEARDPSPGSRPRAGASAGIGQSSAEQSLPPLIYAIGTLGYDFGTEAKRDSFKQLMEPVAINGNAVPPNPYDTRQMVAHLERYPAEAEALIWTLNLELTPLYAIAPSGAFGGEVYASLRELLTGEIQSRDAEQFVDRVSLPAHLTDRSVKLFSGQIVPVVDVATTRGLYGWRTEFLIAMAIDQIKSTGRKVDEAGVRAALEGFLNRVYYEWRNLGMLSADRALNFAATNAFQAASAFAEALAVGMELDDINVEPSPYARQDADAWDVKLKFFDPENVRRARKVFRFTIDVSEIMPVTLGELRIWSTSS